MADLIDPTVKGNYPVILGVGLLGKPSNEIFTGIRYNHKPTFPQADARLKPSIPGKTSSYDLNFSSAEGTVGFAGTRSTEDGDYVLYFDPERKAFVLDKVDSTFNMNLTRTPTNSNPDDLRRRHPHLGSGPSQKAGDQKSASSKDKLKSSTKADNDKSITVQTKKKLGDKKHTDNVFLEKKPPPVEKKSADKKLASEKEKKSLEKEKKPVDKKLSQEKKLLEKKLMDKKPTDKQSESKPLAKKTVEKSGVERKIHEMKTMEKRLAAAKLEKNKKPLPKKIELALPVPEPPKPQESRKKKDDDDEDEEDDDDDLLIEYPGAEPPSRPAHHFSPAFPIARRFDDFMDQRESEVEEDEEAMDEDTEAAFKLPSPVKNGSQAPSEPMDVDEEEEEEEAGEGQEAGEADGAADLEYDLEQELNNAFTQLDNNDQDNSNSNSNSNSGYYYNNNNDDDESEISEED
ncbi:RNA polymerase II transcription elongation factor domain-containing protein [Trichoderma sp. SZMC 28014]